MRALALAARIRALAAPTPPSVRGFPCSLRRSLSDKCGMEEENGTGRKQHGKRWNPILGPDLPEIWNLPSQPPSLPPVSDSSDIQHGAASKHFAEIIDGRSMAEEIRLEIAEEVRKMRNSIGKIPCLAVVLVGQRKDSEIYVHNKIEACQEVGIKSLLSELPEDCAEDDIVETVSRFNNNPSIHGILVQLPLPQHVEDEKILSCIDLEKDVDGFHPLNIGNLALRDREPLFIPCASQACIELLLRSGVELMGKNVTMIGRGKIVGLPTSLLLQRHHATVTVVHALTQNPENITREADIVISAAGVPNLVRGNWLKRGAVVIDVGTNPIKDASHESGYRIVGDVCYEEALQVASKITPVPGGVGPMTIAMLLSSTLCSAKRFYGLD